MVLFRNPTDFVKTSEILLNRGTTYEETEVSSSCIG